MKLLSTNDLTENSISSIFNLFQYYYEQLNTKSLLDKVLNDKLIYTVFRSESTRTKEGFKIATTRLGGSVLDMDINNSRVNSGARIIDELRFFELNEVDLIITRGIEFDNLNKINISIINGGNRSEHPSQALIDLFTILNLSKTCIHERDKKITFVVMSTHSSLFRPLRSFLNLSKYFQNFIFYFSDRESFNMMKEEESVYTENCYFWENRNNQFDYSLYYPSYSKKILGSNKTDTLKDIISINKIIQPFPRSNSDWTLRYDFSNQDAYHKQLVYSLPIRMALLHHILLK